MKRPDYLNKIKKIIVGLEKDDIILRILRGFYEYPEYNDFVGEYISPAPDKIAHAPARNYGWTTIPCGDAALNIMGFFAQVPSAWPYVSDGIYKEYNYGNVKIKFKHTTNKEISNLSYKIALPIQAIKALGKENIDSKTVNRIARVITLT